MVYNKCPGADSFIKPHPEFINCPHCKKETEIWSDETEAKCDHCRKLIKRENTASCLDWCKYVKECIGEEKYKEHLKRKEKKGPKPK